MECLLTFYNDILTFSNDTVLPFSEGTLYYRMTLTIMKCCIMARPKTPFRRVASGVTWNEGRCTHTPRLRPAASVLRDNQRRVLIPDRRTERRSLTTETAVAASHRCSSRPLHGDTNQPNGGPLPRSCLGPASPLALPTPRVFQDLGHHYAMAVEWNGIFKIHNDI